MKKVFILSLFALFSVAVHAQVNCTQYVNPMIGTDFTGHTYPGAILPFGGVQVSPDTKLDGWEGCSGYHYAETTVYGFSHTHLSGTGCSDYGDVLLMPFVGKGSVINTEYSSSFSHNNEFAAPGYYRVLLDKNNIKVELTTATRVAMHKYTFPKNNEPKGFVIDLKHRDLVINSAIKYSAADKEILGFRDSKAWSDNQKYSFSILASEPIQKIEYYVDNQLVDSPEGITGKNCKAIVYFYPEVSEVILKVGVSGTGFMENAHKNQAEIADFDFDRVRREADQIWNKELSKFMVESSSIENMKTFYTALYHCFTSPYIFTDLDGSYMGMDGNVHQSKENQIYTVFSLWDTYRALHPLLNLVDRKRSEDFVYTFMKVYEQGGMLPVWELSAYETWCMIGYHSVPVIWDAYQKGIIKYDPQKMLEAMIYSAKLPKLGRTEFAKYGYIPAEAEHENVSKAIEYAFDDWCIAMFAKSIGNMGVYNEFIQRAQYYKNNLDPQGFMRPKYNGAWWEPFDPAEVNNNYTEANSWQYSTYVPQDFTNYINLKGGETVTARFLDSLFNTSSGLAGRQQADVTGLIGQYAHGNEPSHHATYLYSYVGQPWKTQQLVRKIMTEFYTSKPDGLIGNEDCGQMSAWMVFSSMGFYPVCPGDNKYVFGSPLFNKMTVSLENGKKIELIAHNNNAKNIYIQSVKLNGKPYSNSYITYDDLKNGAIIEFEMGATPNMKFGADLKSRPVNQITPSITINPIIAPMQRSFKDSVTITLSLYQPAVSEQNKFKYPSQTDKIYYTLDGTQPTNTSILYSKPFVLKTDAQLKVVSWNEKTGYSKVVDAKYYVVKRDKSIKYLTKYSPQYTADGDEGLIDHIRGSENYRLGGWQSFWGNDCEVVIDLLKEKEINEVSAGFLQDVRSWIWFPKQFIVEVSVDGIHFEPYGIFTNPYDIKDETLMVKEFKISKKSTARYLKIKATNFGIIPAWHLGDGNPAHLFIDEIVVQ
ncbi:MAG: hypothetical protein H6Q25_1647 [Bacteroidetes bacterium]|nr:hypothetical protein [Bacteroidota bacterium]